MKNSPIPVFRHSTEKGRDSRRGDADNCWPPSGTEGSKPLLPSGEFRANLTWVIGGPGSDFNASGPPDAPSQALFRGMIVTSGLTCAADPSAYERLREDKPAAEVRREVPIGKPEGAVGEQGRLWPLADPAPGWARAAAKRLTGKWAVASRRHR